MSENQAEAPAPQSPHVPDAGMQIGNRVLSPKVSEAVRKAMEQFRAEQSEDPGAPVPMEAPQEPGQPEKQDAPGQVPSAPPAQELPPHIVDAAVRISQGQQAIEKQRAELKAELEALEKFRGTKTKFSGDRLNATKEALGYLTEENPDDVLFSLVEDYTRQVLGIEPSSDQRALSETAKLRADIQALRREQAETQRKSLEDSERKQREDDEREAVETVGHALAESSKQFPFLATLGLVAQDGNPGSRDLVWQEIRDEHARSGQTLSIHEAAQRVDKSIMERLKRFAPLFSQMAGEAQTTEPGRPKSDRPRTVSSSLSSAPMAFSSTGNGQLLSPDERRRQTLAKIGQALRGR